MGTVNSNDMIRKQRSTPEFETKHPDIGMNSVTLENASAAFGVDGLPPPVRDALSVDGKLHASPF